MKKLLITGISGLLGVSLAYILRDKYRITGWYNDHKVLIPGVDSFKVDITDKQLVQGFLADYNPEIILHCASLTDVDYCEENKAVTEKVNVGGTRNIVSACANQGTQLVYVSTDSVYDGKIGNYTESDPVFPCNFYGLSKYKAENTVKAYKNHIILRTNIFGWNIQNKHSLAEWILYNLERGCSINGFNDAIFSSIYTMEFARIIDKILDKDLRGIFNFGSRTSLSKFEFAILLASTFNKNKALIKPMSIESFSFSAKRGKDLSLNTQKLSKALGEALPSIEECVYAFFKDFQSGLPGKIRKWSCSKAGHPTPDIVS